MGEGKGMVRGCGGRGWLFVDEGMHAMTGCMLV